MSLLVTWVIYFFFFAASFLARIYFHTCLAVCFSELYSGMGFLGISLFSMLPAGSDSANSGAGFSPAPSLQAPTPLRGVNNPDYTSDSVRAWAIASYYIFYVVLLKRLP